MFTGLVEAIGVWRRRAASGSIGARALIETSIGRGEPLVLGESVSVDGACLTVDRIVSGGFEADLSAETLAKTKLGALSIGTAVHLERATPLGGRMGGHTVLGHVDGVGRVSGRAAVGDAIRLEIEAPRDLSRFLAEKGPIAVDGVSLTLNAVRDAARKPVVAFEVMLVPHTLRHTKLGDLRLGAAVNIEVDVLARYVTREVAVSTGPRAASGHGGETNEHHVDDQRLLQKLRSGGWI